MKIRTWMLGGAMACASVLGAQAQAPASDRPAVDPFGPNSPFKHIVIIYQENHSFDNLYGHWGPVEGDALNGVADAPAVRTTQVRQDNTTAYQCLLQNDVNLTSPPLAASCNDTTGTPFSSAFANAPFRIEDTITSADTTCPVRSSRMR